MRILVVSHNYPRRSATGAGLFVHRLNRGLAARDIHVDVLQLADWAPPWPLSSLTSEWRSNRIHRRDLFDLLDGITIHHPATVHPRPSRFFDPDIWERQVRTLVRYVRRRPRLRKADVVLGHFLVPDGYHAVRLAEELGMPSAAMAWGDDVHAWPESKPEWRKGLARTLSECGALIACSKRLAADGAMWVDRPTRWEVVYAGTDLEAFHQPDIAERTAARRLRALSAVPADARILLMIAQPVVAKGYLEILQAWETLAGLEDRWRLVMIGANWGNLDISGEIVARGLTNRAHWLGPQPAADIPSLLRASDGFVLPSHNEGLSLSVMEAMATGLPVIATDVGGHSEILSNGENGWLVPARDVPALTAALHELITDQSTRDARGRAARVSIERLGSPDDSAGRLADILRRLVARGRIDSNELQHAHAI